MPRDKDNIITPFVIEDLHARGRIVSLGATINTMLARHNYPESVAHLLAQMVALTALLGSSLKTAGKFSLQTTSDGPVNLLVCNFTAPHNLRAYAKYNAAKLEESIANHQNLPAQLLGRGSLAFTMEPDSQTNLYQGIVELDGEDLAQLAEKYYIHSEQIPTKIKLASSFSTANGWRAGGLLLQYLPHSLTSEENDSWQTASALAATTSTEELLDQTLGADRLLFRLFHEHKTLVFNEQLLKDKCSCDSQKILQMLQAYGPQELSDMVIDGGISVECQFCSQNYNFSLSQVATPGS